MKRIFFVSILLALALGACSPVAAPTLRAPLEEATLLPSAEPSAAPSPTLRAPTGSATPFPASATPASTQKAPSTPTTSPGAAPSINATQTAPDCAAFPGFPACGASLPLNGKLAVFDAATQTITVLDFKVELTWKIKAAPQTQRLQWLDGGSFLVTYDNQDNPTLAWANPVTSKIIDLPRRSPSGTPVFNSANGSTAWMEMGDTQFFFHIHLAKANLEQIWPAGEPGDKIHEILGWVPGASLLLAGHHFSSNSMWVTGDRLYTLDPASGMIKEMPANLRLGAPFDWHPSQPGLMVFGDSSQGAPRLSVLDVITGKVTHLIADESVNSSYPSWTADGKAILHAASKVGSPAAAGDPFALPAVYLTQWPDGATRRLTNPPAGSRDDWPQPLPDGNDFLYLRVPDDSQPVELRLGTLDGSLDALVGSGLGPAPSQPFGPSWESIISYAP